MTEKAAIVPNQEIEAARERLADYLTATPILYSRSLSEALQAQIFLKLEIFQPTHSFKVRGAFNVLLAPDPHRTNKKVITASGCVAAWASKSLLQHAGERVIVIVCGANVAMKRLNEWYMAGLHF